MAHISTLISDVLDASFGRHGKPSTELKKKYSDLVVDNYDKLTEEADPWKVRGLRLSSVGKCARAVWYDGHKGYASLPFDSNMKLKFHIGDCLELSCLLLAELSGHEVTRAQETVEVNGVIGHIDAVIDGVLIDIKSCSGFAFKKYQTGKLHEDDPFGYRHQLSAYAHALGIKKAALWVINKETGEQLLYNFQERDFTDVVPRVEFLKEAISCSNPPNREYGEELDGKSGNKKLGINCRYCSHKHNCWGEIVRVFQYSTGEVYLTEVAREPNVPEITKQVKEDWSQWQH